MTPASDLINKFVSYVIDPAILLVFTAGFLVFVWGIVEFLWELKEGAGHEKGVQHMIWGMVGMLIMVSVYGLIALIDNTFQLDIANPDVSRIHNVQPGANFFGE